ncbi:unnamed protein product [Tilletia controversa]|nr:unnamed protein product [Tilletia controversa]
MKFTPNVIGDRVQGEKVSRIKAVRPGQGNAYYIRQILLNRPIRTWADMKRSLDGTVHASYREAAERDGLVSSDDEPIQVMQEAVHMHSAPADLRFLLALMTHEGAAAPALWDTFKQALSRDFLPYNYNFDSAPAPVGLPAAEMKSVGTDAEQAYFAPKRRALRAAAAAAYDRFTTHQKHIYDTILTAISDRSPDRLHLIQGRAGRGKTFVIKGIIDYLRGHGKLLAVCGATGLSASAFDRGTTVHKRFTIPVQEDEDEHEITLRSSMRTNSPAAAFLRSTEAIIIDEIWSLPRCD